MSAWTTSTVPRTEPYVTRHAVDRFRQRVLPDPGLWSFDRVRRFLVDTLRAQPGEAVLVVTRAGGREWRYFVRGECRGEVFYLTTNPEGFAGVTVLNSTQVECWTVLAHAFATRLAPDELAQLRRRAAMPTRRWTVGPPRWERLLGPGWDHR